MPSSPVSASAAKPSLVATEEADDEEAEEEREREAVVMRFGCEKEVVRGATRRGMVVKAWPESLGEESSLQDIPSESESESESESMAKV